MELNFIRKERGEGKTTSALERLDTNKNAVMVVHSPHIKNSLIKDNRDRRDKVLTRAELNRKMEGRHCEELIIDELPTDQGEVYLLLRYLEGIFAQCSAPFKDRNMFMYYTPGKQ